MAPKYFCQLIMNIHWCVDTQTAVWYGIIFSHQKATGIHVHARERKGSREKFMTEFVSSKKEIIPKWYMCVSPCKFCFNSSAYLCIKIIGVYTIRNELSCAVYGFNSLKFVPLSYKLIYREWMSKRKRKNWQKFCHAALLRFVECVCVWFLGVSIRLTSGLCQPVQQPLEITANWIGTSVK